MLLCFCSLPLLSSGPKQGLPTGGEISMQEQSTSLASLILRIYGWPNPCALKEEAVWSILHVVEKLLSFFFFMNDLI